MANLEAFIPIDRRLALSQGRALPDRTAGTALFADISGFTALTEALAREFGRKRGAETVLRYINPVFDAIITDLHRYGGSVIGFAGDSITCWFDAGTTTLNAPNYHNTTKRALACAFAMQRSMTQFASVDTPGGTSVALSIKIALTAGAARRFIVGDPSNQLFDVLAGDTLQRMAAAEGYASGGEIVVGEEIVELLDKQLAIRRWHEDDGRRFALVTAYAGTPAERPWALLDAATLAQLPVREWTLNPIHDRMLQGAQFLGELRPITALFCKFAFIDFDSDDAAGIKFDQFVRWIQTILLRYGGTLIQLTIGDKGSYFYAAFGAPYTFGDDSVRALATAVELQTRPSELAFIDKMQIGISRGQAWSGACGSSARHTFGVMGNQVNMAARLMGKAQDNQILVNAERITADAFRFVDLGTVRVKGRRDPLPVAALQGQQTTRLLLAQFDTQLVGRDALIAQIASVLTQKGQRTQRVVLHGSAGMGKSHLAATACRQAQADGWQVATALCQSVNQTTIYYPWQQLFRQLLELPLESAVGGKSAEFITSQITTTEQRLGAMNDAWLLRAPLLGDLLGLPIEDNTTTAGFDPQLRQESLFALVLDMLRSWASEQPLLLFIDAVEWCDDVSLALLDAVGHGLGEQPLVVLSAQITPPNEDAPLPDSVQLINVPPLAVDGVVQFVEQQLEGAAAPLLTDLVYAQAHGNPYFTRELVKVLRDGEQLVEDKQRWVVADELRAQLDSSQLLTTINDETRLVEAVDLTTVHINLPDSVHNIVLARIDQLPERQKLTLKVASVVGQVFQLDILLAVHPSSAALDALRMELTSLESADFTLPRSALVHLFKHSTEHDVAYETLLFAQRRDLHRTIACWYESLSDVTISELDNESLLAPNFAIIAFHWRLAEDAEREQLFATLAGHYAAANYANTQAIRYFTQALDLTSPTAVATRFSLLLAREQVLDALGERERQSADLTQLQALANQLDDARRAETQLRLANYQRWTGNYDQAIQSAAQAAQLAQQSETPRHEAAAYFLWGRVLRIQREYAGAQQQLQQAYALAEANALPKVEADSLLDMGSIAYYRGELIEALALYQTAETIYRAIDDGRGHAGALVMQAIVRQNEGRHLEERTLYEEARAICRRIGYRVGESNVLGNLAVTYEAVGEYEQARAMQEQVLQMSRETADVEGESFALSNLALLQHLMGASESAETTAQQALRLHRQLKDGRSEAYTLTYLGHALTKLGRLDEAAQAQQQALAIRQALDETHLLVGNWAGLARVAAQRKNHALALAYANRVLQWIDAQGSDGIEHPLSVLAICVAILQQQGDARAQAARQLHNQLRQQQADAIQDDSLRRSFLQSKAALIAP